MAPRILPHEVPDRCRSIRRRLGLSVDEMAKGMGYRGGSSWQKYEEEHRALYLQPKVVARLRVYIGRGDPPVSEDEILEMGGTPPADSGVARRDALKVVVDALVQAVPAFAALNAEELTDFLNEALAIVQPEIAAGTDPADDMLQRMIRRLADGRLNRIAQKL